MLRGNCFLSDDDILKPEEIFTFEDCQNFRRSDYLEWVKKEDEEKRKCDCNSESCDDLFK